MVYLFLALIVLASVALGAIVLIQNPKGGGLAGNVGGLSNNIMGVKQTNDVLEKGTWIFAGAIAILALTSSLFLKGGSTTSVDKSLLNKVNTSNAAPAAPAQAAPSAPAKK